MNKKTTNITVNSIKNGFLITFTQYPNGGYDYSVPTQNVNDQVYAEDLGDVQEAIGQLLGEYM